MGRRAGVGVLVLIIAAAGLDLLGPRTGEASADGDGYSLALEFPQIARAGEPAPLIVDITSEEPIDGPVTVRFCGTYFEHLDFQAWYPTPSAETSETSETDWVVYEFDPPTDGSILHIALDARIAPGQLGGRDTCEVSVLDQGQPVVTVAWTTWRIP
jgi:hypothetical protein